MTYVKRKHCALKFLKRAYIRTLLGIMYPTPTLYKALSRSTHKCRKVVKNQVELEMPKPQEQITIIHDSCFIFVRWVQHVDHIAGFFD